MTERSNRLNYLDWLRGLAAAIMLQGHVLDSWLRPQDRDREWFWLSQFLGGMPAPIFLFLVGISLAIVLDRMRQRRSPAGDLVRRVLRRGGWLLLLAYVFRVEQFLVWYPWSKWNDIYRVDTLNCIAACSLTIGLLSLLFPTRRSNMIGSGLAAIAVISMTPFLYPLRPGIPPTLAAYFNGNGTASNFSLIPWVTFALAGMSFGYALLEARDSGKEERFFQYVAAGGICAFAAGSAMSLSPMFEYGFFDYSLTSPHFVLIRLGMLMLALYGAYLWCRRERANRVWSPLRALGQSSLIVYWVHIEIVYGRFFRSYNRSLSLPEAVQQIAWIVPLMVLMAWCSQYGFVNMIKNAGSVLQARAANKQNGAARSLPLRQR